MIRLVQSQPLKPLAIGDAQDVAKAAYVKAKAAQRSLASHMLLLDLLHRPGMVSYYRLRGERAEARKQLERAQAVHDHLNDAIEAMEAAAPKAGS